MESSNEFLPKVQIEGLEKSKKMPAKQNAEDGKKCKRKKSKATIENSNVAGSIPSSVEDTKNNEKPSQAERFVAIDP